jgi:hypothetical protein
MFCNNSSLRMRRRVQPRRLDGPPDYLDERAYQQQVKEAFDRIYGEVEIQWRPFRGEGRGIYAPIVDIAVGPFAITRRYIDEYGELLDQTRAFIERLIGKHSENCEGREENARFEDIRNFNENARCLLCSEIEESGTRKHCLGNLVNASALGRIGILVRVRHRYSERSYDSAYLHFLAEVQKNNFKTRNALVLTAEQLTESLAEVQDAPGEGL